MNGYLWNGLHRSHSTTVPFIPAVHFGRYGSLLGRYEDNILIPAIHLAGMRDGGVRVAGMGSEEFDISYTGQPV